MSNKVVMALGADMKNRFLVAKNNRFYFGPDIGDLSNAKNYEFFKKEVKKAIRKFKPDIITSDLHPGYFSSRILKDKGTQAVQHHHAHIASVIEEHGLKDPVIGVSFDGTGLGTDGNIWGGEFFLTDKRGAQRVAHFKYLKLPGGDKVTGEPWRMVISMLGKEGASFLRKVNKKDIELVLSMCDKNINSPLSSSAGRLFDAAAALIGICEFASYEAEGPIKLEKLTQENENSSYRFKISKEKNKYIIDIKPLFLEIIEDLKKKRSKSLIATKFHNTMVSIIVRVVSKLSKENKIKDIALSGGVFQNKYLKNKVTEKLSSLGFKVFSNVKFPVNDLNISLGQYYVSCNTRKN